METDKISVIVPIYNIEQYLGECIQSIVNQTYTNLEILLVDDESPDKCGAIVDEWALKDSRIRALHKKNGGLGDSRNFGFANSTGELIAFIDGDDYIDETYFEKLYKALKQNDSDIAGCRFFRNNTDGKGLRYPDPDEAYRFTATTEQFMERVYNNFGVFCVAWGKLYKREIIEKDMYPIVKCAEDAMVIRKIAYKCRKISYIPDPLYMYRDRPGSIMTAKRVYSLENQKERMLWLENDISFYRSIGNNKLQALAEKAYCFNILSDWNSFDKECKEYYKPKYYTALRHMVSNEGNSIGSKCKYIAFGLKMMLR
jgi:glycosyltransferase involved in cell wall biosynthesis